MIIGFDAKRAFYNRSGLGNYSRDTIRILSKYFPQNKYFLYSPGINPAIPFTAPDHTEIKTPLSLTGRILKSYWRSFSIAKQLESDKINIYHGLSNELPFKIHETKIKSVVTIHDLIFMRYPELYKVVDRKIYEKKFRHSCQIADRIIAISNQTKNDIVDFFGIDYNKIDTVYQSCHSLFKEKVNEYYKAKIKVRYNLPEDFILYLGTIEKRKNVLNVIKAMKEGNIDFPLIIVGKPTPYLAEIKNYISINNLQKKISVFHNIPLEDLPAFYQMSYAFIYPSIFEGFGIPIIEALYSGTPVITSKGSCFHEAGGENSIYIDPNNTEEIAHAINIILKDFLRRETMIKKGLMHVQKFNDANVANNLISVYQKTIDHAR